MPTFTIKEKVKNQQVNDVQPVESADAILLQAVLKYREIQAQVAFLQNELKAPRSIIESAVQIAGGSIITPKFKITYTEVNSERFDKEAAIKALGRKTLKPFLSTSTYFQLRVS